MDGTASEATPEPQVFFRGKKRKTYRQRTEPADDNDDDEVLKSVETQPLPENAVTTPDTPTTSNAGASAPNQSEDAAEEEKGLSVAEVLRLRNARKARLGGVRFGASSSHGSNDATTAAPGEILDELSLMIREEENKALDIAAGVQKRFAPQTGLATEMVNQHMEEYIEAQLRKRHNNAIASTSLGETGASSQGAQSSNQAGATPSSMTNNNTAPKPENRNRALQGQLMEIDLGDEARNRNEALTERARRKLQGEALDDDESGGSSSGRPKKVRLGRDGKPWRPRNRRTSDDIRRDQLVEEILRENRLDVYETPTPPPGAAAGAAAGGGAGGGGAAGDATTDEPDGAADDRIAEEFRREFMDAMAERQQKRKKPANAPPGLPGKAGKDEDVLKGPKLGGSRNVRAAMRNLLLEKAKEGKKPSR
ncbi:hypothetical protein M426DRAFT_18787 [Hypoxylon sp. CI-4A]|nr:hypothetical protein M426DRAFT_18787 [Hypoxylon sp. CI-4A]